MPELIRDGETGFLVDSLDEAIGAIERIGELDRAAVRRSVEDRFTIDRMAGDYIALYEQIINGG
jgi:glycosyltransferase involved in cell wall biosynthesis